MYKVKRPVTFGSLTWAHQPRNENCPTVELSTSMKKPSEVYNPEDCSYSSWRDYLGVKTLE